MTTAAMRAGGRIQLQIVFHNDDFRQPLGLVPDMPGRHKRFVRHARCFEILAAVVHGN